MTFQDVVLKLSDYWRKKGCLITQPYPTETGALTFDPFTFFKVLDKEPWRVAYYGISKRPKDGRYAENPNRLQQFYQYQVILKPPPDDVQELYLKSLEHIGINLKEHDVRFVEDDWESEALGARGLGWEVWLDGLEITQFTYFQEVAGFKLNPPSVELTYGLERICMFLQKKDNVFEIEWGAGIKYGELFKKSEYEFCRFNYDDANVELYRKLFDDFEKEAIRFLTELKLLAPGYDYVMKCSHILNILDARRAIGPEERKTYIARVRKLAHLAAKLYLEQKYGEVK